jgi:hypothetical protein
MAVWWRAVMLNGGQFAAACNEQASKTSPTRRSGLVVKNEKEIYRREEYLSVVYLRKSIVALLRARIIAMARMKTTWFSCRDSSLRLATP